jgi:hypothetical protein
MYFNYDNARNTCKKEGMAFDERIIAQVDDYFKLHSFTQQQVDAAIACHIWAVKNIFTPKNYTTKQRILLALHFLFK